jgi:hypothetical protein
MTRPSRRMKIPTKCTAVAQKKGASSTQGGPSPENHPSLNELAVEAPARDRPLVKPRPQPRLNSPAAAAVQDDADERFNMATNHQIDVDWAKVRTRARIDAITAAADTDRQVKARLILEQLAHREAPLWRDNHLPQTRDEIASDGARVEGQDGEDGDGGGGEFDGDSDVQRRALNRVVQLGLDANDPFVQTVLQQGPPRRGGHGRELSDSEEDPGSNSSESGADTSNAIDNADNDNSENPGVPAPDVDGHFYEYNYNTWSRYFGDGPRPGAPSAVERLSWYRMDDDCPWLEIPNGMRIPRVNSYQDQEAAQHELACSRMGIAARRELPVFKEPKPKNAAKISPQTLRQKLAELGAAMELDPTKVVATESEGSGSDYSETERNVLRRKGIGSADEDGDEDEDEDEGEEGGEKSAAQARGGGGGSRKDSDDASDSDGGDEGAGSKKQGKPKGKRAAKGDNSKGKEKAGTKEGESNNNSKGKEIAGINEGKSNNKGKGKEKAGMNEGIPEASGGRPSAEQLESVKELREAIDERVAEISAEFGSSRESILRQLGLGVWKDVRKMSLWNMFTQIKSLEGAHDDVNGCE